MCALICVADLEVLNMATDMVLVRASVSTENIEQDPRLLQCLATVVSFHHRHHIRGPKTAILESAQLKGSE